MSQKVKVKCRGSSTRKLSELKVLQGDLKELTKENYQKLRNRIQKYGFDAPFFIWDNYILDGTQRKRVLEEMFKEGWTVDKVPVVEVQADNINDAKQRLLGYVSQYGDISDDGLYEFLNGIEEPDLESLDLPDFDMDGFAAGFLDNKDLPEPDSDKDTEAEHKCPKCGYEW